MAGDSPGRAEQQESSGETAGKAADPGLAARRESAPAEPGRRPQQPQEGGSLAVAVADDPGTPDDGPAAGDAADGREEHDGRDGREARDGTGGRAGKDEPERQDDAEPADAEPDHAEDAGPADARPADAEDAERHDAEDAEPDHAEDAVGEPDAAAGEAGEADGGASADADGAVPPQDAPESTEDAPLRAEPAAAAPGSPAAPAAREEAEHAVAVPPAHSERPTAPPAPVNAPLAAAGTPAEAPSGPPAPPPAPPLPWALPAEQPVPEYGPGRPTERERTKQQPLPPAPEEPLKLLAALTNTPPPRQTLLRAGARRVKIWTPLVALLAIVFVVVQAVRPLPAPALTPPTLSSYTFSGASPAVPWPANGQAALEVEGLGSLGTHGAQKPEPIASVAKIMTAYLVLHDHPFAASGTGAPLTVDAQAAADYKLGADGESVVKVTAGQKITEFEALEDIMIASANNIARMLSRWDAGSEAAFVKKMNATAKSFGMDHTTYTDPSGLTATTVSTASDQVKLTEKVMADPVFRKVVAEPSYRTASGDTYNNWNHLVGTNNVVGVKTGTSTAAGGNLVFAAYKQVGGTNQLIIGCVLGQYKPSILDTVTAASLQLVLTAQQSLTSSQVIKKGDVVGYVDNGLGGRTPVVATRDVQAVGWPGVRVGIALSSSGIPHSAKAGTTVGTLTVGSGPGQIRIPVALRSDLNAPGFGAKLTRLG